MKVIDLYVKIANGEKFVDSFINNTTKTLENSWRTKINIDFEKIDVDKIR